MLQIPSSLSRLVCPIVKDFALEEPAGYHRRCGIREIREYSE